MKLAAFEAIAAALRDARVRYLVAGGLAVNAHGYVRLTWPSASPPCPERRDRRRVRAQVAQARNPSTPYGSGFNDRPDNLAFIGKVSF